MIEDEAKLKTCILLMRDVRGFRSDIVGKCMASECFAYWRWIDDTKVGGYCSLGGKPEF